MIAAPPDNVFAELLDTYAPFAPAPLCPEISVFQGRSLIEVWEAAEQIAGQNLSAPFWAYPWAAGCALARVILDTPAYVRDKRVLDLGAGGGVVTIACAHAGAKAVVANDVDAWALATVRIAAERQQLAVELLLADLTEDLSEVANFDVVLCSDMAYERRMTPRYAAVLQRARNCGAEVLIADAGRTYFDDRGLTQLAEYQLAVPRDLEGVETRLARVFRL
jgi:predicted nicotinamide N-methyase